uniref:Uncharacterized protein n=1 Tax=Moniliophthora roreri TaxID=221103 RepID=A0A0W0F6J6_MONRR
MSETLDDVHCNTPVLAKTVKWHYIFAEIDRS